MSVFVHPVYSQNLPTVKTPLQLLESEMQKMITAGPLRTSYIYGPDFRYNFNEFNQSVTVQEFDDYFHNPADTIYVLAAAYPLVNASLQPSLRTYMQNEFTSNQPYKNDHRGTGGAAREYNDVPQDVRSNYQELYDLASKTPTNLTGFVGWSFNPFNFYALYKYAQVMGNAQEILTLLSTNGHANPGALPADSILIPRPHVLNSYIAGYYGFRGLRQLAGLSADATNESRLTTALQKKVQWLPVTFTDIYDMSIYESGGFLWLVPELGVYLRQQALTKVNFIVENYQKMLPYWMIPNVDEATRLENDFYNEGTLSHLYDQSSSFLAKAYVQQVSQNDLMNYLHNSGMYRGDLFYIQNLIATVLAGSTGPTPTPGTPLQGDLDNNGVVNSQDYIFWKSNYSATVNGLHFITWLINY